MAILVTQFGRPRAQLRTRFSKAFQTTYIHKNRLTSLPYRSTKQPEWEDRSRVGKGRRGEVGWLLSEIQVPTL